MAAPPILHDDPARGEESGPNVFVSAYEPCCGSSCGVRHRSYVRVGRVQGLDCEKPVLLVRGCGAVRVTKCEARREDKCGPCSSRHRRYLIRRAEMGCMAAGWIYMLTLTAPGVCEHDRLDPKLDGTWANSLHPLALAGWRKHPVESRPACPCRLPEGGLEEWNPTAGRRWNHMRTALARAVPGVEFLRVVEPQDRGALHLHVLVRSPVPLDVLALQAYALAAGFGCSLDLSAMPAARAARYVAKYAAKGYVVRANVPWKDHVLDKDTGEMRPRQTASYRTVSQSQGWGMTVSQIKAEIRASLGRAAALHPPVVAHAGAGPIGIETATVGTLVAHSPP